MTEDEQKELVRKFKRDFENGEHPAVALVEYLKEGAVLIGRHGESIQRHETRIRFFEKLLLEGGELKPPLIVQIVTVQMEIEQLKAGLGKAREATALSTSERKAIWVAVISGIVGLATALIQKL